VDGFTDGFGFVGVGDLIDCVEDRSRKDRFFESMAGVLYTFLFYAWQGQQN
jgi:hypothetical protein